MCVCVCVVSCEAGCRVRGEWIARLLLLLAVAPSNDVANGHHEADVEEQLLFILGRARTCQAAVDTPCL